MMAAFAALFVLLAVACGAFGVYLLSSDGSGDERLRKMYATIPGQEGTRSFMRRAPSSIPPLRRLLSASEWTERAAVDLDRAHVNLRVGEYLLMRVMAALLLLTMPLLLSRGSVVVFAVGVPLGIIGYFLPALWVSMRQRRESTPLTASSSRG
jgi:hypothetical protein